jgi:hypothetical protein
VLGAMGLDGRSVDTIIERERELFAATLDDAARL